MTPLAQKIVNELTLPKKHRTIVDHYGAIGAMPDAHCFDMTDVVEVMKDLAHKFIASGVPDSRLGFLPAPVTWIEWVEHGQRVGFLLQEDPVDHTATVFGTQGVSLAPIGGMAMQEKLAAAFDDGDQPYMWTPESDKPEQHDFFRAMMLVLYAALAMINTPRHIGRRQHSPHTGLMRKLAHARGGVGKYPLHAWTEILLDISPPHHSGDGTHEGRLSGRKALHFCRKFSRVKLGRVEWVTSHWRGDPALGMKRSRYRVVSDDPPESRT
jgi:hypothetical protein